ncbi:MAG TPA: hypothetical protein VGN57_08070 [Pirellulaceae bacterium]|jgi:hypothetical protein|nr:hypothetical protein [Pirellulaceae bacterium]
MSRFVVKLRDRYLEWSTGVDAPVTEGMTREAFRAYWLAEYGPEASARFEEAVGRSDATGASDPLGRGELNRAGPDETSLNDDELYRLYCLGETLDEETVRRKIAERDARIEATRPSSPPLGATPTEQEVRRAFEAIQMCDDLAAVEATLGSAERSTRQRGGDLAVRWTYDDLIILGWFDKTTERRLGCELRPNYASQKRRD